MLWDAGQLSEHEGEAFCWLCGVECGDPVSPAHRWVDVPLQEPCLKLSAPGGQLQDGRLEGNPTLLKFVPNSFLKR